MSLSYTTGNPTNLTGGTAAAMNDIAGPFTDIKTFLTDGSGAVGDTILASPTSAVWRTVLAFDGTITALTTSTWYFALNTIQLSGGAGAATVKGAWTAPTASDIAVNGKTTRLRLRVPWMTNATSPGIGVTWGLYPLSSNAGGAGVISVTLGTVVAGSTANVAAPIGSVSGTALGASFDFSTLTPGNFYVLGVTGSGSQAANSLMACEPILEMRHT